MLTGPGHLLKLICPTVLHMHKIYIHKTSICIHRSWTWDEIDMLHTILHIDETYIYKTSICIHRSWPWGKVMRHSIAHTWDIHTHKSRSWTWGKIYMLNSITYTCDYIIRLPFVFTGPGHGMKLCSTVYHIHETYIHKTSIGIHRSWTWDEIDTLHSITYTCGIHT